MKKHLKQVLHGMVTAALAVTLFAVPAMAGGDCGYGTDDIEDECDLWMVDDATQHWCVCYNHLDENGEYPITFGPEPHTFEDGRCTTCGRAQADDAAAPESTIDNTVATVESDAANETVDSVESISDGSGEDNPVTDDASESNALATEEQGSPQEEEEQDGRLSLPPVIAGAAVLAAGVGGFALLKKKRGGLKK